MRSPLLPIVLAALLAGTAAAQDAPQRDHDSDHDRARQALQRGEVVPLEEIITAAKKEFGGQLIEAEFEDGGTLPIYEIKLVTPDGKVVKLLYDARDGSLLKRKQREPHK